MADIIPDPDPDPNPDPAPDPQPGAGVGARPDWLPEEAWGEAGPDLDKLGALFTAKGKDEDVPAEGSDYAPPTIEGLDPKAIADNPTYQTMAGLARELGIGQARFTAAAAKWIEQGIKTGEDQATKVKTELGANADQRLQALSNWASSKLTPEEFTAFRGTITTAQGVAAMEKLMGGGTAPRTPAAPATKSEEEIRKLMQSDAYSGDVNQRDPKVIAEVNDWFRAKYGAKA